jgi:hypothetical protein
VTRAAIPLQADVGSAPRRSGAGRLKELLAGLVSIAAAGGICIAIALRLPRDLRIQTDIVGYPIHQAYNPYRVTQDYFLGIAVFPLFTLLLYLALTKLAAKVGWINGSGEAQPALRPILQGNVENTTSTLLGAAGRTLALDGALASKQPSWLEERWARAGLWGCPSQSFMQRWL